jgi:hypothetical protein
MNSIRHKIPDSSVPKAGIQVQQSEWLPWIPGFRGADDNTCRGKAGALIAARSTALGE